MGKFKPGRCGNAEGFQKLRLNFLCQSVDAFNSRPASADPVPELPLPGGGF